MAHFSCSPNSITLSFNRSELTEEQMRGLKLFFGKLEVPSFYQESEGHKPLSGYTTIGTKDSTGIYPGITFHVYINQAYICRQVEGETVEVAPDSWVRSEGEALAAMTTEERLAYVEKLIAAKTQPKVRPKYECIPAERA